MENIVGQVTALVTVLLMVAVFVEAILEAFAPLLEYIKDVPIKTTVNLVLGAALGFATAAAMGLRVEGYLTFIPVTVPAVASYVLIGCAAGAGGSRFWHAVLGFLSNIHLPTLPTTTTTVTQAQYPPSTKVETTTAPTPSTVPSQPVTISTPFVQVLPLPPLPDSTITVNNVPNQIS
jgi:hypothetical protein